MYQLDHDPLSQLTQDLEHLLATPVPRQKLAQKQRERQITDLIDKIETLKRFYQLQVGEGVTNGQKLGRITDLSFSPGGMPQVWVTWDNGLTFAETVNVLKPEPVLQHLKVGDLVTFDNQSHIIKAFQGHGAVLTQDGKVLTSFTPQYWDNNYAQFTLLNLKWSYQFQSGRYWIEGVDYSLTVDIPTQSRQTFPSPQAFLEDWLNTTGNNHWMEIHQRNSLLEETGERKDLALSNQLESQSDPEISQLSQETPSNDSLSELTDEEQKDRLFLERKVERAFYEAGKALMELRDRRLYRSTHKTFEEYCRERFGHSRQKANFFIAGAKVYDNLTTIPPAQMTTNGCQKPDEEMTTNRTKPETDNVTTNGLQNEPSEMTTNGTQILPTSERQVRPLTQLDPEEQRQVWRTAVEQAGGKVPSSRMVKDIVTRIREKRPVPNPYRVGDVVTLLVKENPELRGKGGFWGIISEIHEFSCTVRLWDGEYTLQIQHLQEMPLSPSQKEEMKQISDRLVALYAPNLEDMAKNLLASLGKINRPYLTPLEEQLLGVLEPSLTN